MSPWTADKDFAVGCSLWLPRKLYQLPPCSSGCRQTASLAQAHLDSLQQGTPLRPGKWMKFPIFLVSPNLPVCFTGCVKKTPDTWSERVMWLQLLSCRLEAFCHLQMIKKKQKTKNNVSHHQMSPSTQWLLSVLLLRLSWDSLTHRAHHFTVATVHSGWILVIVTVHSGFLSGRIVWLLIVYYGVPVTDSSTSWPFWAHGGTERMFTWRMGFRVYFLPRLIHNGLEQQPRNAANAHPALDFVMAASHQETWLTFRTNRFVIK